MTGRERVLTTLRGDRPDRVALNVFAGWNPEVSEKAIQKWGSLDAWYDRFGIDAVTGVLPRFPFGREVAGTREKPHDFLSLPLIDPKSEDVTGMQCDGSMFPTVQEAVAWGRRTDRAVFVHAWGVFELSQFLWELNMRPGTEPALLNMLLEKDLMAEIYVRLADWTADCVECALDAGADVVELSDDWGQQGVLLFNPELWWEIVEPAMKRIVDRVLERGVPILLHSDGDVTEVLDGIRDLGLTGLHPVQESAGMDFRDVRETLGTKRCIMGGLDTITALPVMNETQIREEVRRVFGNLAASGPYIFSASHMFQDDTDLSVIEAAYDEAMKCSKLAAPAG